MANINLPNGVSIYGSNLDGDGAPLDGRTYVSYYEDIKDILKPYLFMRVIVENDSPINNKSKGIYIITKLTQLGLVDETGIMSLDEYFDLHELAHKDIPDTDEERTEVISNLKSLEPDENTGRLGYKVVLPISSKNTLTFAEQVVDENTIYEIRDVFDLDNDEITIPNGCTLLFNGGRLENGTLTNTDNTIIEAKGKVFSNISFSGYFEKQEIKVAWFISEYPTSTADYTIDNTDEIQEALDCGSKYIVFPANNYLHVAETLVVDKGQSLLKEHSINKVMRGNRSNGDAPCIYTKETITIIDYQAAADTIYIGDLNLVSYFPFDADTDRDLPILKVSTTYCNVWGVDIYANIKVTDRSFQLSWASSSWYHYWFTGILLETTQNYYMAIINLYGYIKGCYTAIRLNKGAWLNSLNVWSFTYCVRGFVDTSDIGGGLINFFNDHQSYADLQPTNATPYLYGRNIRCYGTLWDLGVTQSSGARRAATVPIKIKNEIGDVDNSFYANQGTGVSTRYSVATLKNFLGVDNGIDGRSNLLNLLFNDTTIRSNVFRDFHYTASYTNSSNEDVSLELLNNEYNNDVKLINYDYLFNEHWPAIRYNSTMTSFSYAHIANTNGYTVNFELSFVITKPTYFEPLFLFIKFNSTNYTNKNLLIEQLDSNYENPTELFNKMPAGLDYYDDVVNMFKLDTRYRVTMTFSTNLTYIPLPMITIPVRTYIRPLSFITESQLPNINTNTNKLYKGKSFYVETYNQPIFWNGSSWVNAQNKTINILQGTTANRPSNLNSSRDKGYQYYDTTLGRVIVWNGTTWTNVDGSDIIARKGSTSSRPSLTANDSGFQYYDTTLNKYICWNGTDWVNLDGTALT